MPNVIDYTLTVEGHTGTYTSTFNDDIEPIGLMK